MPGNTFNFNNHHEVAYSFCLDSYIFNANICIGLTQTIGGALAQPATSAVPE